MAVLFNLEDVNADFGKYMYLHKHNVFVITTRRIEEREAVVKYLTDISIPCAGLYMWEGETLGPPATFKRDTLTKLSDEGWDIQYVVDAEPEAYSGHGTQAQFIDRHCQSKLA